jgi:FkbM family methyltransferase
MNDQTIIPLSLLRVRIEAVRIAMKRLREMRALALRGDAVKRDPAARMQRLWQRLQHQAGVWQAETGVDDALVDALNALEETLAALAEQNAASTHHDPSARTPVSPETRADAPTAPRDERVEALSAADRVLAARIEALEAQAAAANAVLARVDVLGARVDVLGARVDVLGARVDVLGARVDVLESRSAAASAEIAQTRAFALYSSIALQHRLRAHHPPPVSEAGLVWTTEAFLRTVTALEMKLPALSEGRVWIQARQNPLAEAWSIYLARFGSRLHRDGSGPIRVLYHIDTDLDWQRPGLLENLLLRVGHQGVIVLMLGTHDPNMKFDLPPIFAPNLAVRAVVRFTHDGHELDDAEAGAGTITAVVLQALALEVYVDPVHAIPLIVNAHDSGMLIESVRTWRTYGVNEFDLMTRHLRPGDTFLDIGANAGIYTAKAAQLVGPTGRVIAIEPHPMNIALIRSQMALLPHPEVVTLHEAAAGDRTGAISLYTAGEPYDYRTFQAPDEYPRPSFPVPLVRGDAIVPPELRVHYIKSDTQGYEVYALEGCRLILERDHPVITVEFWPYGLRQAGSQPERLIMMLLDLGYHVYKIASPLEPIHRGNMAEYIDIPLGDQPGLAFFDVFAVWE